MFWFYSEPKDKEWKRYFAWKPRPVGTYPLREGQKMVWWEWMERRILDCREGSISYEYREIPTVQGKTHAAFLEHHLPECLLCGKHIHKGQVGLANFGIAICQFCLDAQMKELEKDQRCPQCKRFLLKVMNRDQNPS